ncbi:hypothetical protein [Streptomyces subrutilus]|uniref:hypothetical protein n=1 Tax=Streptomyces subrutilus TaxID=36818 RepID=UPI0033F77FCB
MSEQDSAELDTTRPDTRGPDTAGPGLRPDEVGAADSLPALVLLVPASLLLRFLGEHAWAYWTAAVIGVLGLLAAGFGIAAAVGSLRRGRRKLLAGYTVALLLAAGFVLVVRLVEN